MATAMTYGGWVKESPAATGSSLSLCQIVSWMAIAGGVALSHMGTGSELSLEHLQRAQYSATVTDISDVETIRTPSEDLARIREVLKPAISDLATTLGVSRQSVYNWINGDAVAADNADKLRDLAQAADVLTSERVVVNAALLKRKFVNGKTLLQVAQTGGSALEAAQLLVKIYKREAAQRERMNARFAKRAKTPATADFDLPVSNDYI